MKPNDNPEYARLDLASYTIASAAAKATEALTEEQLRQAFVQAVEAGDFVRYVIVTGDVFGELKQRITYEPLREATRHKLINERLVAIIRNYFTCSSEENYDALKDIAIAGVAPVDPYSEMNK